MCFKMAKPGEVTWWLRVLAVLPEDLGSIPSTTSNSSQLTITQFQGICHPLLASKVTTLMWIDTCTYVDGPLPAVRWASFTRNNYT